MGEIDGEGEEFRVNVGELDSLLAVAEDGLKAKVGGLRV